MKNDGKTVMIPTRKEKVAGFTIFTILKEPVEKKNNLPYNN